MLIVDDEPNMRFLFRVAFEGAGYTVEEAADGRAALEAIAANRPDLVATDFMMPVLDGRELIERVRADPATSDLPILLVSSSNGASRVSGADVFMQKPFDPQALVEQADALLAEKGR